MNYRDFFKNKKATAKDIQSLIPEGVDPNEFNKGIGTEKEHTDDEFVAAKIAGDHLKEDPKYYTKLSDAGLEQDECATCGCGDPTDDHMHEEMGDEYDDDGGFPQDDFNDGLPKLGGALAIPHRGQPIMMGKIIQVGSPSGTSASGELSGMTNVNGKSGGTAKDRGGLPVNQPNDKEPLTAGGKNVDSSIATKTVGGAVAPNEGQKQGGPNSQGTIAATSRLDESKQKVREIVKQVLKEIRFDKKSGKWIRLDEAGHKAGCKCTFCSNKGKFGKKKNKKEDTDEMDETVDMKMGPSYKTVQPRMYDVIDDDRARTNQYDPEITEMYDDEEECMMNERYVELANAQRNLSEAEIVELKTLREKIDNVNIAKRNFGASQGGVEPNMSEDTECRDATMNMGASYKVGNQPQYRTLDSDQAHRNQDCPYSTNEDLQQPISPAAAYQPDEEPMTMNTDRTTDRSRKDVELGHPGQVGGFHSWKCSDCGNEITSLGGNRPQDIRWKDGHVCHFEPDDAHDVDKVDEAGIGAVQHSSYRVLGQPDHGNHPQDPKTRWAADLDESGKPSKAAKAIKKGMKPKKSTFKQFLKHQKPKKTSSGVHKRKP